MSRKTKKKKNSGSNGLKKRAYLRLCPEKLDEKKCPEKLKKKIQAVTGSGSNGLKKTWKFTNLFNPLLPSAANMRRNDKILILI